MSEPSEAAPGPSYLVVVNGEEQYSIWAEETPLPPGWRPTGFSGSRQDCLAHIEQVWTDMRPLSLQTAG
jgi:MbtH protein